MHWSGFSRQLTHCMQPTGSKGRGELYTITCIASPDRNCLEEKWKRSSLGSSWALALFRPPSTWMVILGHLYNEIASSAISSSTDKFGYALIGLCVGWARASQPVIFRTISQFLTVAWMINDDRRESRQWYWRITTGSFRCSIKPSLLISHGSGELWVQGWVHIG